MELSYRIIKNASISSSDDRFVIDTDTNHIKKMIETYDNKREDYENKQEEIIEKDMTDEKKLKILTSIDDYKKRVNEEIQSEKKNILEIARIEAKQEAIEIRETARSQAYKEGYAQAMKEVKEEASKIKENALDILKEAKEYRDNYLRENEKNIYSLAKAMAENIINHLIDIDDENIILLIKPLLLEYLKEEDIVISSNAEGKVLLEKHREKIEKIAPNTRFIFLEDKSIDKNGFIIENNESIVDLQIESQLENMLKEISDIDG